MMTRSEALPEFDAVIFDLVGTLVDEVGAMTNAVTATLAEAGIDGERSARAARQWIDAFHTATRRIAGGEEDWIPAEQLRRSLLEDVLLAEGIGLTAEAFDTLASAGRRLGAFPHAAEQLSDLAELTTVSTVTNASTGQLTEISRRNGLRWHATLSAALARTYKPAPAVYALAIEQLDLDPSRTLFVAAHPWDLRAAGANGFRTGYLPRPHTDAPEEDDDFDIHLDSLAELAEALREGR